MQTHNENESGFLVDRIVKKSLILEIMMIFFSFICVKKKTLLGLFTRIRLKKSNFLTFV